MSRRRWKWASSCNTRARSRAWSTMASPMSSVAVPTTRFASGGRRTGIASTFSVATSTTTIRRHHHVFHSTLHHHVLARGPVNSIAVHPSGKLAFSVSKDKTLRMWNLVKGRSAYIRRLDQEATCVFLSQDGNRYGLVMGNHVSIFGSANAELVGALEHKKKVHTAAFATNDLVVLGTDDGVLYLYRAQGQLLAKISHPDITARIRSLQVVAKVDASELPYVVLVSTNGVVQVYDLAQFSLSDSALEANNAVEPVASARVFGTALVTCLSACRLNVDVVDDKPTGAKKPKQAKSAAVEPKKTATAVLAAPTIVVEHEVTAPASKTKRKAQDSTDIIPNGKKTKVENHGPPAPNNNKAKKANKQRNK
ncbi:hypothetical protein, variant 2 [Aphanomyces astaci]|uniref:Uncharacterized protein n=2 Tax=Aphanomyces astaci TaxID=112090 RepID=W4HDJ0_APHAT|nr:hypothetical protein, variant 2 [Aphanomyces astaci]ETV89641.1 hypothetical protein, variant 2 [Aphanomyces astaci]|eukprot:XP_009822041.1 hypothetical protein, variant 2 [Aphanomyces astaci]